MRKPIILYGQFLPEKEAKLGQESGREKVRKLVIRARAHPSRRKGWEMMLHIISDLCDRLEEAEEIIDHHSPPATIPVRIESYIEEASR